jgi:Bacterial TniB protein
VVLSDNLSHLLDTYSARALLPDEERIEWIKQDRWIHYSRAERVLDRLTALLHYPPRDRMPCVLLFGATGMQDARLQMVIATKIAHPRPAGLVFDYEPIDFFSASPPP